MKTSPHIWEIDNLPNRLTLLRVALVPVIVFSLWIQMDLPFENLKKYDYFLGYFGAWTFVGASLTDFFDGYFARKRKLVTVFGSFLDPIADKFLVVSSLIMLLALGRIHAIVVALLVLREFYVTSLRLLASDHGIQVPVDNFGKWKTTFQMIGIPLLMAADTPWPFLPMLTIGKWLLYFAAFLSSLSAVLYTFGLIKKLKELVAAGRKHHGG